MSFILNYLRRVLRRPPVAIFIVLVLGSCLAGYAMIYSILTANLHGDYLELKSDYLEMEFPKHWFGFSWKSGNETAGMNYNAFFSPIDLYARTILSIYDEVATPRFMDRNHLKDAFSVTIYGAELMYNSSLQNNQNATLHFIENGTIMVSEHEAEYTRFAIEDGIEQDSTFYNLTGIFISWIDRQRLVEVAFWGKDDDWNNTYDTFESILGTIKI